VVQPDPSSSPSDPAPNPGDPTPPASPVEPAPEVPVEPQKVAVRRSGGFTGQVRSATIELDADPQGEEVRRLLRHVDLQQVTTSESLPDRFVYTVEIGEQSVTVGERDLTPDLQRVVQIVLGSSSPDRSGPDLG